jgi:cephalosporin hydroxylase
MEARTDFLGSDSGRDFKSDLSRNAKLGFTFHPKGWLRRVTPNGH